MSQVTVRIPQMGEGLQEARLVEYLKQPGDAVRRDEPIYVMETDKAVTEVESPFAGQLVEWLVEPDTVLPIGTAIARIEVAGEAGGDADESASQPTRHAGTQGAGTQGTGTQGEPSAAARIASNGGNFGIPIPPRTRKYLREKGLLPQAKDIPAAGKKLLPEDVDRFLASRPAATTPSATPAAPAAAVAAPAPVAWPSSGSDYADVTLPKAQQTLNYRMHRGAEVCLPAVLEIDIEWSRFQAARQETRTTSGETAFSMLAWCVVQAMRRHDRLRSSLLGDGKTLRTYRHVNLGVAVAVEDGLLRTAVVRQADRLNRESFSQAMLQQIELVRGGEDQIDATTTVTISNIGASGVRMGIPVIVTPAVATIALGQIRHQPYPLDGNGFQFRPVATLTMTFDHRIMNGVAAADFLREVKQLAESFRLDGWRES